MSLKSWCFNRQSTQVRCFILHDSRLHVHNNLYLLLRRARVDIICWFRLLLSAQSRWTMMWSSNNFHCQYIPCIERWIGFTVNIFLLLVIFSFRSPSGTKGALERVAHEECQSEQNFSTEGNKIVWRHPVCMGMHTLTICLWFWKKFWYPFSIKWRWYL